MRTFSRPQSVRIDEENPYWISFSDLMSALLVIFILAAVALIIELTEIQKKIQQDIDQLKHSEQARRDILYEVKTELAKHNILVIVAENDTVLRIPETTLTFASNRYSIPKSEKIRTNIIIIGQILQQTIIKPFDKSKNNLKRFQYLDTVFIEGHTDSIPSLRNKGNWGLSSYRAISLWEFWGKRLVTSPTFAEMKNSFGQNLFSVSGYAASRRVQMVEKTPRQRAANRRIHIRFTVKRPTISQLKKVSIQ